MAIKPEDRSIFTSLTEDIEKRLKVKSSLLGDKAPTTATIRLEPANPETRLYLDATGLWSYQREEMTGNINNALEDVLAIFMLLTEPELDDYHIKRQTELSKPHVQGDPTKIQLINSAWDQREREYIEKNRDQRIGALFTALIHTFAEL